MKNRLEKLRFEIDILIREKQPNRDSYFFSHLYGVSHFCTLLAIKRNLNVEIATVCGMLHDIYPVLTGSYVNHDMNGAKQAKHLLQSLDLFSNDEIAVISTAIANHSNKDVVNEPMDEVLKDADVLHHVLYDTSYPVKESEIARQANLLLELGCTPAISQEQFSIPGAGGIVIKDIDSTQHILLQTRSKQNAPNEDGLLEIPAGKIRAFESIFDTLKREIKEETGLDVTEIRGESGQSIYEGNQYKVINFTPFSCSQNVEGDYPIMVFVFICQVRGNLLPFSNESKDYKWVSVKNLERMLSEKPESFYPMHIDTLRKYCNTAI